MTFKLSRAIYNGNQVYTVYPSGHDHGRGFSSLAMAFAFINAIIKAQ